MSGSSARYPLACARRKVAFPFFSTQCAEINHSFPSPRTVAKKGAVSRIMMVYGVVGPHWPITGRGVGTAPARFDGGRGVIRPNAPFRGVKQKPHVHQAS